LRRLSPEFERYCTQAITETLKQSLESDTDGSLRLQLGRAYQATGQTELARAALKDYEEFRRAAAGPPAEPAVTPPEAGPPPPPR